MVYVPDSVYELVEAFVTFMDRVTLVDMLVLIAAAPIEVPLLVLIHEVGHAIAVVALRRRVAELTVGNDEPVVTVRVGEFRLRLGALTGQGDVGGFVLHDGLGAGPRAMFVIALAGPLASLAGALGTGALAVWSWPHIGLSQCFVLATFGGLVGFVSNLRVSGQDPASWSDGVWVRAAWHAMRRPAPRASAATWLYPHEATSTPLPPRRSTA